MIKGAMKLKPKAWKPTAITLLIGLILPLASVSPVAAQAGGAKQEGSSISGAGRGGQGMMRNAPPLPVTAAEARAPVEDQRIFVPMPPEARKIMREQMKQFLVSLSRIQGLLADGDLPEASKLAEATMGRSEQRGHGGQGPGRYMPIPMRNLAWGMHDSASTFAETAAQGDVVASYRAFANIQNSCVACHFSYRNR
jgi:hypothetical protein